MISRKRREKLNIFKQRASDLADEGYSLREISEKLDVEFNFKRSHQWVKDALKWAKDSKETGLSTDV